jgi:hypothetical protein
MEIALCHKRRFVKKLNCARCVGSCGALGTGFELIVIN